ncbi:T9SS type A sorting domain-containing protein [Bacteroidota bacterium]
MKTLFIIISIFLNLGCVFAQSTSFTTNQNADLMISGVGFNNTGGPLSFNHPSGLASNGSNLLMCDRFNNRVLIWQIAPTTWNTPPDLVLGQENFTTNNPGTSRSGMNWPGNVSVASNGKLAIADTNNGRLLLWNSFPTSNAQAADISIHLPSISPTGTTMNWQWPWGIWTDGTRLAAVATQGSTILFWNTFPTEDDQQPDYTITHDDFGTPRNISTDGSSYFFVGDHNAGVDNRAGTFFWNSYPSSEDQTYDFYREEWIKGTSLTDGKFIASGLRQIYIWNSMPVNASQEPVHRVFTMCYDNGDGVDVVEANGKIYICNYNGNSVLVYDEPPTNLEPDPQFAIGVSNFNNNTLDSLGIIQNSCLATDGTRLIITSDFDIRIYVYNNFPTYSGQLADQIISTEPYDLGAWDNVLYNDKFVAAGRDLVCVWEDAGDLTQNPSKSFSGSIGSATFNDLKGVALDNQFFYLADRNGKIYIWNGIPANNTVNPIYSLDLGDVFLNRISSDGTYLCVGQQIPASILIYKVADISLGVTEPWKTIDGTGFLNLPSEAITFNGSLAISNQSFHNVLLWEDINDAPDTSKMIVLGQSSNSQWNKPAIGQNRLFMPGSMLFENNHLWVGEHKFSTRILRFSTSISGTNEILNSDMEIDIYPNPLSDATKLKFTLNRACNVSIYIVNSSGQQIKAIQKNTELMGGAHSYHLDMEELPRGIYILHLNVGNNTFYRKLIQLGY